MARPQITIRFALIALLFACVVPLTVGLGVSAYLNSRQTIDVMWRDLADELLESARDKTLRHIEPGASQLRLHRLNADSGQLDPADHQQLLGTLHQGLLAHPEATWCSYGGDDGSYFAAYRTLEDEVRLTSRVPAEGGTRQLDWLLRPDGSREPVVDRMTDFDSRTRPWWPVGSDAHEPTWAPPFLFASRRQPGVVLTLRQDRPDGSLRGIWLMEYELSHITRFLQEMKRIARQRGGPFGQADVYIAGRDGMVIGHAEGQTVRGEGEDTELIPAAEHPDEKLRHAYLRAGELGLDGRQRFEFEVAGESYLGMSAPFDSRFGPDWTSLVTIPSDTLLGPIHRSNRTAAVIAGLVAFFSMVLGLLLAERLVRPLSRLAGDLDRIGRLEFEEEFDQRPSVVREIADMHAARDRMTGGLRSFAKYVPAGLVRRLMDRGEEAVLGGRTRELTIYFSDIVGYTPMAEALTARQLVDGLAEYFGEMSTIIDQELGTVDKYIGDAIMAFWGEHGVEEHAIGACRAALRAQQRLATLREQWQRDGQPEIFARIGINSGPVLIGNIGSESRMNYTVMGDPVNVASRVEQQCKTYQVPILIAERTRELAGQAIVARPLDKIVVKGKEQGLVVHQLQALRADASPELLQFEQRSREAFDVYLAGDFKTASAAFGALLEQHPGDNPLLRLKSRCDRFQASPPPDWTGIVDAPGGTGDRDD